MPATQDSIVKRVKDCLARESGRLGLTVKVLDEGVRVEDDDYWYVPVQPNVHPAKTSDYYEMLAEIETTLLQEDNLSVTLIPTLPDEQS